MNSNAPLSAVAFSLEKPWLTISRTAGPNKSVAELEISRKTNAVAIWSLYAAMNGQSRRSTRTSRPRLRLCASRATAAAYSAPGFPLMGPAWAQAYMEPALGRYQVRGRGFPRSCAAEGFWLYPRALLQ